MICWAKRDLLENRSGSVQFVATSTIRTLYLAFLSGVLCSGGGAVVAPLAGESIWSSDGVDALEVHDSAPGDLDRSRSGDSAEVNLVRRLCWKRRERDMYFYGKSCVNMNILLAEVVLKY